MAVDTELMSRSLALSSQDRAEMAHRLLLSLEEDEPETGVEQVWADEIERRLGSVDQGKSVSIDWGVALQGMRDHLRRKRQP